MSPTKTCATDADSSPSPSSAQASEHACTSRQKPRLCDLAGHPDAGGYEHSTSAHLNKALESICRCLGHLESAIIDTADNRPDDRDAALEAFSRGMVALHGALDLLATPRAVPGGPGGSEAGSAPLGFELGRHAAPEDLLFKAHCITCDVNWAGWLPQQLLPKLIDHQHNHQLERTGPPKKDAPPVPPRERFGAPFDEQLPAASPPEPDVTSAPAITAPALPRTKKPVQVAHVNNSIGAAERCGFYDATTNRLCARPPTFFISGPPPVRVNAWGCNEHVSALVLWLGGEA